MSFKCLMLQGKKLQNYRFSKEKQGETLLNTDNPFKDKLNARPQEFFLGKNRRK